MHDNRTAKVVQLIGSSTESFEDAVANALQDATETTRGIHGCDVTNLSVKCDEGAITEYRAVVHVAFGIER